MGRSRSDAAWLTARRCPAGGVAQRTMARIKLATCSTKTLLRNICVMSVTVPCPQGPQTASASCLQLAYK